MVKVRCTDYGNCPLNLDDGNVHDIQDIQSLEGLNCPFRNEGQSCGAQEDVGATGGGVGEFFARLTGSSSMRIGFLAVLVALLLGGAGYALYKLIYSVPSCEVAKANDLLELDPKLGELEATGSDCLEAGMASANPDQIVAGMLLMRTAFDRNSPIAAYQLGRMFDPLKRPELEDTSADAGLLPAVDEVEALRFYDAGAKLNPDAAAAAAALRARYPELGTAVVGRGGNPVSVAGHPGLYRRVLSKPGAKMAASPGGADGKALAPFNIYYVFETRAGWLRIGETLAGTPAGWVREGEMQDWPVMMVLRYTPPDSRNPALFFKDDVSLKSILGKPDVQDEVTKLIASAQTDDPDPRLAAVEDRTIDWSSTPYLMPILSTSRYVNDAGRTMFLTQVASVSGPAGPLQAASNTCQVAEPKLAVHQIVFAIDTTQSMGPYIDGVRRISEFWAQEVQKRGLNDRIRFGVVAYRNNMDAEPQRSALEYVSKPVLPLSHDSDASAFSAAMRGLSPAKISTHSFDEDAVAGLDDALNLDWDQACGLRMLFLITDAGALQSDDPKASRPGTGLTTIAATARAMNVDILPVHVLTKEARAAGNTDSAAQRYRSELSDGRGGDTYRSIANGSPEQFRKYLGEVSAILDAIGRENRLSYVSRDEIGPSDPGKRSVSQLVLGKLFSVQQRFLGTAAKAQVPTFNASWTSDRDLANPDQAAFDVSVLLTRQQLGQLAEKCQSLVDNAKQKNTESSKFFELLRMVSAATAQDPKRFASGSTDLSAFMPSFLSVLPYKSDVLSLNAEDWRTMGANKQDAFVRRLEEKLKFYRRIERDQNQWKQLSSGVDAADQVALVPLSEMP